MKSANNNDVEAATTTFSVSGGFADFLARLDVAIGFTSYQSGLLYMLGRSEAGGLNIHQSQIARPMGLAHTAGDTGFLMTAGHQLFRFENVLRKAERANGLYDACFAPRTVHITGRLDAHDVGVGSDGEAIFVNTRFNCLATVDARDSFRVLWTPPFIDRIVDEDRCHLNGLAMRDGKPAFVSAISRSNTIDGWRDRRADGGVVLDVTRDQIVCEGLSMPHSPRIHDEELWLLNSGTGELGRVCFSDSSGNGRFEAVKFCPGFLRGLAIVGKFAFVGLSKPRYKRFEGLMLDNRLRTADSEPWCGIQVIDLSKGVCVEWLRLDGAVAEIYDVAVFPGIACPMSVSPGSSDLATLITHASREPLETGTAESVAECGSREETRYVTTE